LWRLRDLYGFNITIDLVFDGMHCISLNIFKKYIQDFVRIYGSTDEEKRNIEDASEVVGRARLKSMGKRWPTAPTSRLGYFKAEEY
jgi:hypothetical protein